MASDSAASGAGGAEGVDGGAVGDVRVKFVTSFVKYRVTETPFAVPVSLTRRGLSEVINHLLDSDESIAFDFMVSGKLLRTSLSKFLRREGLSGESIVTLQYAPAMPPPDEAEATPHPDWIGSVASVDGIAATGCYDGSIRLFNDSGVGIATVAGSHRRPIRCVALSDAVEGCDVLVASGAKDGRLRVWHADLSDGSADVHLSVECEGHSDCIEDVAVDPVGSHVVSASWDGTLALWRLDGNEDSTPASSTKRSRKTASASVTTIKPHSSTEKRTAIMSVVWPTPLQIVSAGHDHNITIWDLARGTLEASTTLYGNKVVNSIAMSPSGNSVVTAHPDAVVRLWDPRAAGTSSVKLSLRGHDSWVTSVAWAPFSEYLIASASHDGSVRLWDVRATKSLHVMGKHEGKALCVAWQLGAEVPTALSGGEDKVLRRFELQTPAADSE